VILDVVPAFHYPASRHEQDNLTERRSPASCRDATATASRRAAAAPGKDDLPPVPIDGARGRPAEPLAGQIVLHRQTDPRGCFGSDAATSRATGAG